MDFTSYTKSDTFNTVCTSLNKTNKFGSILLVRYSITAPFFDNLFTDISNVTRITYTNDKYPDTEGIPHSDLFSKLTNLDTKWNLICVDPFHEYTESIGDLSMLASFLTDDGLLICHDCYPLKRNLISSTYHFGFWCGVTYGAFIEFAYNNPNWFYTVLNTDYGLGVMSKVYRPGLEQNLNRAAQQEFIKLLKTTNNAYLYFRKHSKDLINARLL
jgi:hypothetical protein